VSIKLGNILGLVSEMLVEAQVEYSIAKLDDVELEPMQAADFKLIEENGEFIETSMLNQTQVFYRN